MNKSYWHIIKEKQFIDWLKLLGFDINFKSISTHLINNKIHEISSNEIGISIRWVVSNKNYCDKLGACVIRITISTFSHFIAEKTKYIRIEKIRNNLIRKQYTLSGKYDDIKTDIYKYDPDNQTDDDHIILLNMLDEFLVKLKIQTPSFKKYLRNKKLNILLS